MLNANNLLREENQNKKHKYPLGTVVEVDLDITSSVGKEAKVSLKGTCTLYVVSHDRDCDGTPLYTVSDFPVVYQCYTLPQYAKKVCQNIHCVQRDNIVFCRHP